MWNAQECHDCFCGRCQENHFSDLSGSCRECTACSVGTYRVDGCGGTRDTICMPCTTRCPPGYNQTKPCSPTSNLECARSAELERIAETGRSILLIRIGYNFSNTGSIGHNFSDNGSTSGSAAVPCKCRVGSACSSTNHDKDWCYIYSMSNCSDAVKGNGGPWSETACGGSDTMGTYP